MFGQAINFGNLAGGVEIDFLIVAGGGSGDGGYA